MTMTRRATRWEFSVTRLPGLRCLMVSRDRLSDMGTRDNLADSRALFLQLPKTALDIFGWALSGLLCVGEQFLVNRVQLLHGDVNCPQGIFQTQFHRLVQAGDRMPMIDLAHIERARSPSPLPHAQDASAVGAGNGSQFEISRT
jgi:hypothetical protein